MAGRGGFTLAEMLVALTGASLLAGTLLALIWSQSRFHLRNEDGLQTARTSRALLDGMGAEIRAAGPGDLIRAAPDTVSIRLAILKGVVCDSLGSGGADVFVYDSVRATNLRSSWRGTAWARPYAAGPSGNAGFRYADGFKPTSATSAVAATTCRAAGADSANQVSAKWFRRTSGWSGAFQTTPGPGSIMTVYGRVTYAIRSSTAHSGTVSIRRNGQEFATFLTPSAAFEYVLADGTVRSQVADSVLARVREVRLQATAMGRNRLGAQRPFVYAMPFRN